MQTAPQPTAASVSTLSAAEPAARPPTLVAVDPARIGDLLAARPEVAEKLERVAERSNGRWMVSGMIDKFATGQWHLWLVWDGVIRAVVATELYTEMTGIKCLTIRFCTGRQLERWKHLIAVLEDFAVAEGCVFSDMVSRKGYARELPDYKLTHVLLEKDLR